jgi:DNA-binding CsgD family transcriptional regulator
VAPDRRAAHPGAVEPGTGPLRTLPLPPRRPTSREREILALLATGATDNEISDILALSPATVQTHVRNAKTKLGARTRAQAVALAIAQGMIAPR